MKSILTLKDDLYFNIHTQISLIGYYSQFIIFILLAKGFISYDSELIIILCIYSFVLLVVVHTKDRMKKNIVKKSLRLKQEYKDLIILKEKLLLEISNFWSIFLTIENQILNIFSWIKFNIFTFLKKSIIYKNFYIFYIIKDQLNIILKDEIKLRKYLTIYLIKNSFVNLKMIWSNNIQNNLLKVQSLYFYLNKLSKMVKYTEIFYILLNKLNINKEYITKSSFISYYTYIFITNKE